MIMATKTPPKTPPYRKTPVRQSITFELVQSLAPSEAKAATMSTIFGLEPVDYPGIRDNIEECVVRVSNELTDNLNEKALAIFLQRLVGAFVGGAHGAAEFYGNKKSEALGLNSRLLNDHRDEDRDAVAGFESRAARAAQFAAEMGLQAHALMAAAHGACAAYEHITGDVWKPYERDMPPTAITEQKSTATMMATLTD
jgi:hypothetical protein